MNEDRVREIVREQLMAVLGDYSNIPLEIQKALELRLSGVSLLSSSHTGETKAVNEGGIATYNVANAMDGFVETTVNGTTIYIPYYL